MVFRLEQQLRQLVVLYGNDTIFTLVVNLPHTTPHHAQREIKSYVYDYV